MEKATLELVEEFKSFISYVLMLDDLNEQFWNSPLAEGKWTLKDVITHIMLWDKYFYEEAIYKIKQNRHLTVRHLNFDEFNANAIEYSKTQSKKEILDQFIEYRMKIINDITGLNEEEYTKNYMDGDKKSFSIREYLSGFIPHDQGHKKQIEELIERMK